jgi:hypothetical protein
MPLLSSLAGKARFAGKLEPAGFGLPDETPAALAENRQYALSLEVTMTG